MKRVVYLLLVVLIAFAGCYNRDIDPHSGLPVTYKQKEDRPIQPPSRPKITKPERVSSELKAVQKQNKALLVRLSELEIALTSKTEVARIAIEKLQSEQREAKIMQEQNKALLVRISELEVAQDTQRLEKMAETEVSENMYYLYELTVESQKVTIETLQKLCRLYESSAEKDSGGP